LSNYQDAILSVARFGDTADVHWPVRYFAVSALADETMQGSIIEIDEKKVQAAEAQGILENRDASMVGCWFGDCPEHPDLQFYIRYRPLREKPLFSLEDEERLREGLRARGKVSWTYYFSKADIQAEGSPTLSEFSLGPEDLIRRVEEDDYVPEIEGDFPDENPLDMVHHRMYPHRGDLPAEPMIINAASQIGNHSGNMQAYTFHCSYPYQGELPKKEESVEGAVKEEQTEEMFMEAAKQLGDHQGREKLLNFDLGPDVDF
jgi:hypothetical protein